MNSLVHKNSLTSKPNIHLSRIKPSLQAKLTINTPGDKYEQEADAMADRVMRMPSNENKSKKTTGLIGASVHRKYSLSEEEEKKKPIMRKSESTNTGIQVSPSFESSLNSSKGSGSPLPKGTRSFMENAFSADFSDVRVHTDSKASEMSKWINAKAFTQGSNIYFNNGQFSLESSNGKKLLAHELTHVVQQNLYSTPSVICSHHKQSPTQIFKNTDSIQRTPEAPVVGTDNVPFDRSIVAVTPVTDIDASTNPGGKARITSQTIPVTFNNASIIYLTWELYDPGDSLLNSITSDPAKGNALTEPITIDDSMISVPIEGRYTLRCIGYNAVNEAVSYADRSFYVWISTPSGKPPDIAALEAKKTSLEADTNTGSGKSLGEVGSGFTRLKDVTHDLAILQTGTGTYVGNQCSVQPSGTTPTDCTNIVLEVLENTFKQQGRAADWAKVKKKYRANIKSRGYTDLSGLDVQSALQSEAGWKGIYWAPDPKYQIPSEQLSKVRPDEASYNLGKSIYYKDFHKDRKTKGYPGVTVHKRVINYAPEVPNPGYGITSTTSKDTTQLNKLKKLPFGVLAAHGGYHMTIITYGKVIEVHWDKEATDANLIEETDLEKWAVGPMSGFHYYASGVIVAPAEDVEAAFP